MQKVRTLCHARKRVLVRGAKGAFSSFYLSYHHETRQQNINDLKGTATGTALFCRYPADASGHYRTCWTYPGLYVP